MTPEMLELLKKLAALTSSSGLTADARQQLELAKENLLKSLVGINQVLTSTPSGDPSDPPPVVDPPVEPEKKSIWGKIKGVFGKIWPLASAILLGSGGIGAGAAALVNGIMGAGTADVATAASSAAAAGFLSTIAGAYKTTK